MIVFTLKIIFLYQRIVESLYCILLHPSFCLDIFCLFICLPFLIFQLFRSYGKFFLSLFYLDQAPPPPPKRRRAKFVPFFLTMWIHKRWVRIKPQIKYKRNNRLIFSAKRQFYSVLVYVTIRSSYADHQPSKCYYNRYLVGLTRLLGHTVL